MTRLAWLLLVVPLASSCSESGPSGPPCPVGAAAGPALAPGGTYCLVANSLSETWGAFRQVGDTLETLPGTGITGRAPNDLEIVGSRMYVVNSGDNTVSVVDLDTGATIGCIGTGKNTNPYELEIDPQNPSRGWLTTFLSGELLELDLQELRVARRVTVGPTLEGVWVGNDTVAVTLTAVNTTTFEYGTGEVIAFAKSDLTEIARRAVPTNPQFVFRAVDDLIHVVCTGDYGVTSFGRVVRIEDDFSAVRDTLEIGGAPGRATTAPNGRVYLSAFCDGVLVYDAATFTAVRDAGNPMLPGVCVGDVGILGSFLIAAEFHRDAAARVDLDTGVVLEEVPAGDGPSALITVEIPIP